MDEDEFLRPRISKRFILVAFFILLCIGYITSSLAANITLNQNQRVEFGQGVYNLKVCDDFININLGATSVDQFGISKVNRIFVNGFDSNKCKNKNFTIEIFKNNVSTPADLFNISSPNKANRVRITVDNNGSVTLINMSNVNVGIDDTFHSINYSNGVYTVTFADPLLSVPDVYTTTIESANNL